MANPPIVFCALVFHWFAVVLMLTSGIMALLTIYPRTPSVGSSLVFWEDVRSRGTLDTYLNELRCMDEAEVERQYGAQNYIVSGILSAKYGRVRLGMRTLMGATPFIILRLIVG